MWVKGFFDLFHRELAGIRCAKEFLVYPLEDAQTCHVTPGWNAEIIWNKLFCLFQVGCLRGCEV